MHEAIGKQASMTEHEEYVRSRWKFSEGVNGQYEFKEWPLLLEEWTESDWSQAAAVTKKREEQIRQMEEEIALMEFIVQVQDEFNDIVAAKRILARERAALAELKRGMK